MSQCDFEDDWEDFTPSLQDQLFENLESVELAAAAANHTIVNEPIIPEQQQSTSIKPSFELFLEEVQNSQKDLSQHSSSSSSPDKVRSTRMNNVEKKKLVNIDSLDDDSIWGGDFDIDMLSVIQDKSEREAKTDDDNISSPKIGFFTAGSKKPIGVSKEAREKAIAMFATSSSSQKEAEVEVEKELPPPLLDEQLSSQIVENMGFVTASGKDIPKPSQKAFDQAKSLLILPIEENDDDDIKEEDVDPPFSVIPKVVIEEEEQKQEEEQNGLKDNDNKEGNPIQLGGFVTANGKQIKPPTKEALERAKTLLHDSNLTATVSPLQQQDDGDDDDDEKEDKEGGETSNKQEINGSIQQQDSSSSIGNKQETKNETILGTKRIADTSLDTEFKYDEKDKYAAAISHDKENNNDHSKDKIIIVNETKKRSISDKLDSTVPSSSSSTTIIHASENNSNDTIITQGFSVPQQQQQQQQQTMPSIKKKALKPLQKDFHLHPQQDKPLKDILKKTIPSRRFGKQQVKPFKSPIIPSKFNLTKAAIEKKTPTNNSNILGEPVFDLINIPKNRYQLKDLGKPGIGTTAGIDQDVIEMTFKSAKQYKHNGEWGIEQAKEEMIKLGCQALKLSLKWVTNHYAMIVWKLASLIRSFPEKFKDLLNPNEITRQLLYRYEREINRGHQSVIKKILEQDDIPSKHMVLAISEIVFIPTTQPNTPKFGLRLTDGWYEILSIIDPRMSRAIEKRRLKVGHKLSITGAKLLESEPTTPLEMDDHHRPKLMISSNSTLPARWDTKLGHSRKKFVYRPIPTLYDDGGMVTMLDIVVCRKYQMMYMETTLNGQNVYRTAKEEEEYVYGNKNSMTGRMDFVPNFKPERTFENKWNQQQKQPKKREDEEERRVTGYFKIKVCDSKLQDNNNSNCFANILISNANEVTFMDIKEGSRYRISFLLPYVSFSKRANGLLHLKTMNITRWEPLPIPQVATAYIPRSLLLSSSIKLSSSTSGYDIDMVAFVLQTNAANEDTSFGRHIYHQTILITDQSLGLCQINLRYYNHPLKEEELNGQVVGLLNLRFERYDAKFDITCLSMTDESELVFKSPTSKTFVTKGLRELKGWVVSHKDEVRSVMERLNKIVQ